MDGSEANLRDMINIHVPLQLTISRLNWYKLIHKRQDFRKDILIGRYRNIIKNKTEYNHGILSLVISSEHFWYSCAKQLKVLADDLLASEFRYESGWVVSEVLYMYIKSFNQRNSYLKIGTSFIHNVANRRPVILAEIVPVVDEPTKFRKDFKTALDLQGQSKKAFIATEYEKIIQLFGQRFTNSFPEINEQGYGLNINVNNCSERYNENPMKLIHYQINGTFDKSINGVYPYKSEYDLSVSQYIPDLKSKLYFERIAELYK